MGFFSRDKGVVEEVVGVAAVVDVDVPAVGEDFVCDKEEIGCGELSKREAIVGIVGV